MQVSDGRQQPLMLSLSLSEWAGSLLLDLLVRQTQWVTNAHVLFSNLRRL